MSNEAPFLEDSGICGWSLRQIFGGLNVSIAGGPVEEHATDVLYMDAGRQCFDDGANGDFRGLANRIEERAGCFWGEGKRPDCLIVGCAYGLTVATGKRFGFVLPASSIDRAYGVNYIFCGQSSTSGDDGFAGGESAGLHSCHDALALLEDRGAACTVNRSIDAASAEQRGVGGVDDGLGRLLSDVGGSVEFERLAVGEG